MRPLIRHRLPLFALVAIAAVDVAAGIAFALHQGFGVTAGLAWGLSTLIAIVLVPQFARWSRQLVAPADTTESVTFTGDTIP